MKHIPNILTAIRILLIPFYIWQMLAGHTLAAGLVLLLSGLTDLLDGALARRHGWITDLGKVLDPVADKLTQAAVSVTFIIRARAWWPFFVVLLVKDFIMLVMGGWLIKRGVRLQGSRWFGKLSTAVFYAAMLVILFVPGIPNWLTTLLLTVVAALAVAAALLYLPDFIKYRREAASKGPRKGSDTPP